MKKIVFIAAILFAGLSSCKKDANAPLSLNDTADLVAKTWTVSFFTEHGSDETSGFDGYILEFTDNGGLTVTKGSEKFTGTWTLVLNNDEQFKSQLQLSIGGNRFMDIINNNWDITQITEDAVHLMNERDNSQELFFKKI